jgi:hypothetical protein
LGEVEKSWKEVTRSGEYFGKTDENLGRGWETGNMYVFAREVN